jgi:Raf kinase inhibitor-like YbhB/YbcL family protein
MMGAVLLMSVGALLVPAGGQAGGAPSITWSPTTSGGTYQYGAVTPNQTASQTFTLTNSGGSASGMLSISLFALSSPAFHAGGTIPRTYTCDGKAISPPLRWSAPPKGTRSFALLLDDPDARGFTHWTGWNIPAKTRSLHAGQHAPREGINSLGNTGYLAPCPDSGRHRYVFRLYALKAPLVLAGGAYRAEFLTALKGKVLAVARLVGRYRR